MAILSCLIQDCSPSIESESSTQIHPLKTFHPSMDFDKFELEVIHPYLREAHSHRLDQALSQLHLTFVPG
jgi:hypothetical protein